MKDTFLIQDKEVVSPVKKKHEYKIIGSTKQKKGLSIFGMDEDRNIYKVEILDKKTLDLSKGQNGAGTKQAIINPTHNHVWALNKKNAIKKFDQ
jgi:hypothetical protein